MQSTLANIPPNGEVEKERTKPTNEVLLSSFLLKEKQVEERRKEKSPR